MAGNISKSVVISDCSDISLNKVDFGTNSSLPTNLPIENETLLSNNSSISINGLLGSKTFMERVHCASDVSQLSILFPDGCLDKKKYKKKKKQSNVESSSGSESSRSISLLEQDSYRASPSKEKTIGKRNCSVNFTLEDSSKYNSSASLKQSSSSISCQNSNEIHEKRRNHNAIEEDSSSASFTDVSLIQTKKSKLNKKQTGKQITSRKVSVRFDYESSPSISEHQKSNVKLNPTSRGKSRIQKVSVNFDNTASDAHESHMEHPANHLENDVEMTDARNDSHGSSKKISSINIDSEPALSSDSAGNQNPSSSNNCNEVSELRRSRRSNRSQRLSVVFGVDKSFPSIDNNYSKVNNENTCNDVSPGDSSSQDATEHKENLNNTSKPEEDTIALKIVTQREINNSKDNEDETSESPITPEGDNMSNPKIGEFSSISLENDVSNGSEKDIPGSDNSDKNSGTNQDSHTGTSVENNISNKTSHDMSSLKDSKDETFARTVNVPIPDGNCGSQNELKETQNTCSQVTNNDKKTEGINGYQHQLNSTYTIENTNKSISQLDSVAENNYIEKQSNEDGNNKFVDENNRANLTYTITSNSKEINNAGDASIEMFTESNSPKAEESSSPEIIVTSAEQDNEKLCSDEDIHLVNPVIHSSSLSKCHTGNLVVEKTNEQEGVLTENPEDNNSIDKQKEIIGNNIHEINLSTNKYQNHSVTLKQPEDIDLEKESNNASVEGEDNTSYQEDISPKVHYVSPYNKEICVNKSLTNDNQHSECDFQVSNSVLQHNRDECSGKLLHNEEQTVSTQAQSIEPNLLDSDNEISLKLSKRNEDINAEQITQDCNSLTSLNKSGDFQPKNSNNDEVRDNPNLNSENIDVPLKISYAPNLSQITITDSNSKNMSILNNNNQEESSLLRTEVDVLIKVASHTTNVSFTGKDITENSGKLRELPLDSPGSRYTSFSKSNRNSDIPGILQENLVDSIPLVREGSDKEQEKITSEAVFSSPKIANRSEKTSANKIKASPEQVRPVKKLIENERKQNDSTDTTSIQTNTISNNNIELKSQSSNKTSLNQVSSSKNQPDERVISAEDYNQEINLQESSGKSKSPASTLPKSSDNSKDDAETSFKALSPKSSSPKKPYGLRKSIAFSPKYNEKKNISGKRRSVTFASTANLRSDSRSEEISLNMSPASKSKITNNSALSAVSHADSEFDMSMAEAISIIPGPFGGKRKICRSTPIKNSQVKSRELKELSNNNKENFSKNDYIFACPNVPQQKSIKSKTGNISTGNRKKSRIESEDIAGTQTDDSNVSLKRRKTIDKTINELSYDTLSDVSEIPLDKTIHQKKLIYHSTPKKPVLEKNMPSISLSKRRRCSLTDQKDKVVQFSKTFFCTSSEGTASISKKKSGNELSTSYSFGGKLAGSKRRSVSTNNYSKQSKKKREVSSKRFSTRNISSLSNTLEDSLESKSGHRSDGNNASKEESLSSRGLHSGRIISTLSHSAGSTTYSPRVHFRRFSSHIDSAVFSASESVSNSNLRRDVDEFDLTPMSPSRVSTTEMSLNNVNTLESSASQSYDIKSDITASNVESNMTGCTLTTPQILLLRSKINATSPKITKKKVKLNLLCAERKGHITEENRLIIDGKSYVPPKIKFRGKWVSPKLFVFIANKLKDCYGLEATIIAERVVSHFCATVSSVNSLDNKNDIEAQTVVLRNILKKYDICTNLLDYYSLIMKFTPFEFQRKILSLGGYFGTLKDNSALELKAGDQIINEAEIINIS